MNTISLVLNGRTAADIALLPEKQRSSITTIRTVFPPRRTSSVSTTTIGGSSTSSPPSSPLFRRMSSFSSFSTISAPPSPSSRPGSSRRSSKESSSGWYNQENNLTLDDFARRLNTTSKKLEIWQGRCAQNVVMALMRPTPLILFVANPVALVFWIVLAYWWFGGGGGRVKEGAR